MSTSTLIIFLFGLVFYVTAYPNPGYNDRYPPILVLPTIKPNDPELVPPVRPITSPVIIREKRFVNKYDGAQQPQQQNPKQWEVRPDISRDQRGNTKGQVEVQKHGENHDINAGYGKVFRGPDKHSETWHVGGSIKW